MQSYSDVCDAIEFLFNTIATMKKRWGRRIRKKTFSQHSV